MARPPAREAGEELKPFTVAAHRIMYDFDGSKVFEGETIMLTRKQAKFYQESGFITFDLGAVFDANTKDTTESGSQAGTGTETEPSRNADDGDDEQQPTAPKRRGTR